MIYHRLEVQFRGAQNEHSVESADMSGVSHSNITVLESLYPYPVLTNSNMA